jgi:hypothetical protein
MTPEKILEIARRFDPYEPDFVMTEDTLIALGQALLEEDRESSEEQISQLRMAMHDIYEVYAGSEGFIPETCPEAYLQERMKEMAYIAGKHKGTRKRKQMEEE